MSRTSKSASRCPVNDEQPSHGEQELDDQLTQEQFDNELEKGLEVMLTQEDLVDDEDPVGGAQGREGGEDAQGEEGDDDEDEDEDDDTSSGGYVSPEDPFPREPRRRPTEDELDKDFDPNDEVVPTQPLKRRRRPPARLAGQYVAGQRRSEEGATDTHNEASAPQPQDTTTTETAQPKRKRGGIRKPNQYHDKACYVITEVGPDGQILEPYTYRAKFRNHIGFVVRDKLNPAIRGWNLVPMSQKVDLWEKLKQNFRFPEGTHELVQENAFKIMGQSFRRWRSDLNKNFIQQKLTPFHEYGNITPSQWEELMAEKTSEASLALSARNSEQAKKNQHYPRLGPGGYAGKQEVFRKMDAEAEAAGNTEVPKLKPRLKQWIYARSVDSSGSSLKFAKPETGEVVSKILKLAEDKEKGAFNPSRERDELTVALGNPEHTGRTRGLGKRMSWKHGFVEERHMYKKHGRDRESNLERQVKALVEKMLVEKGLSTMEPQTLMGPPGELAVVGSPPDVPSSQGSNATGTPVDRIRAPTSCKLVVPMGRQNVIIEVATGVAHPPGGTWHNRDIPQDYTRVEVHTVKPEFMTWKIEHPTPEGLVLLGDVMNQFILWHRRDIVLTESSPTPTEVHPLERPVEDGEVYSPAHDHDHHTLETSPPRTEQGHDDMPHPSPPRIEHGHDDMPRPSPARTEQRHDEMQHPSQQAQPIHEQQVSHEQQLPREQPIREEQVAPGAGDAQVDKDVPEWEARNKIPIKIRPSYVGINDVSSVHKWMAHDQFKPKNQVKEFRAPASEEGTTSKLHKGFNKYPAVDNLKWSNDCPDKYEKGKNFLPNRVIQCLPRGMRKFHDWYLRAQITELEILQAWIPAGTFGAPGGQIAVEFKDIQACFHLGRMEMNLIRIWCLMQADFVRKRPALKHGYIDPSPIASTNFNYPKEWKLDCKELGAGKTLKEKEDIRNKKILEESLKVAAYIALCFKNLQQHDNIWIPYHFNDHWICIGVWLSHSMAWVFDSADFPVETYKDFIAIVKTAFRHYVQEHKGRHHPNRKEKLYVKTLCACPKQKPGSLHCGYYTCIMMSTIGGYNRNPNLLEKDKDTRRNPYKDDELLEMVGDLCNFIMDQIVYHKGTYHHLLSDLGSNPLYQHLRETDRLALGR